LREKDLTAGTLAKGWLKFLTLEKDDPDAKL
jgi:hypothetical protein